MQHHRDLYDSQEIGGDDPGAEFDEHLTRVGSERIWVADRDGDVVGLTGLIVRNDEAELEPMIVSPDHRGQGIAGALVVRVVEAATDLGLASLSVRPVARNHDAIGFFWAAGFQLVGHVELFRWLGAERSWQDGETLAGHRFEV